MISHFQINSQMLRSLVFTGVNPMISIESEEFGTNYHKDSSFSLLILSVLVELGDHGKWWYLIYAGFWVYLGVRTCDVFTSSGVLVFD